MKDGDLISRKDLLKELEKWDWQELYLPIHFKGLVDDLPSEEKTAEETNLTSEELFALDIEQNVKDIDSGEDDSYYRGRLAGMFSAYRILKGKPYEEGEQTE